MGNETGFAGHLLSTQAVARLDMLARLPRHTFPEKSGLFIYVIGSPRGPVKIGVSFNPTMRLRQLQTSTPDKLEILATVYGTYEIEKELHTFYKRERLKGEWFRRSKRIKEFIDYLALRHPAHSSAQSVREMFAW